MPIPVNLPVNPSLLCQHISAYMPVALVCKFSRASEIRFWNVKSPKSCIEQWLAGSKNLEATKVNLLLSCDGQ